MQLFKNFKKFAEEGYCH